MRKKLVVMLVAVAIVISAAAAQAMACNCKNKKGQGSGQKVSAPAKTDSLAQSLLKPYLAIRSALAADKLDGVSANVTAMEKALQTGIADAKKSKKPSVYTDSLNKLMKSSEGLAGKGKSLSGARDAFGYLSDTMVDYMRGNVSLADAAKYQLFYCEMAKHNWLQNAGEKIGNPYYGKSMADCGEKQGLFTACGNNFCDGAGCGGSSSCGDNSKTGHSKHKHGM